MITSNPAVDVRAPKAAKRLPGTLDADQINQLLDIPPEVRSELDIRLMARIDDALAVALQPAPVSSDATPPIPPPSAAGGSRLPERLPS